MTLCQCGCGAAAPVAKRTDHRCGHVRGQPVRFIAGHWLKLHRQIPKPTGERHGRWNGGRSDSAYPLVTCKGHPRADSHGYVREHILIAEKALGHYLPDAACIHHVDGNTRRQRGNLVICHDQAYHMLLHRRQRALDACGHADWRKCRDCKQYDALHNLRVLRNWPKIAYHEECARRVRRERTLKEGRHKWQTATAAPQ